MSSLFKRSFFILYETNTEISKAPIGINVLLTRKSAASKMLLPKIETSDNTLNDKADGTPTKNMRHPIIQDSRFRPPFPFDTAATTISSNEKADVSVANRNSTRNRIKKTLPKNICSNTDGKTIKSNPGPSVG